MNPAVLIASIYVFALAAFLGYQVISRSRRCCTRR